MARLQILPLPEGAGDDRPPFALVIDQVTEEEAEAFGNSSEAMDGFALKAGARAVAVFHGVTIEIPANDSLPLPLFDVGEAERAGTTQLVDAHERTRLELCDALLLPRDTTWRQLVEAARGRQRESAALAQVRIHLGGKEFTEQELREITSRMVADVKRPAGSGA